MRRSSLLKTTTKYLDGEKLYQQRARKALPLLVRQATEGYKETVFYSDLAAELGMPNPRNLNNVLGYIGKAIEALSKSWGEDIPPIQCLVVNKHDGIPGEGIGWFITKKEEFRKLPKSRQRTLIQRELEKVRDYGRWAAVLKAFELDPVKANNERFNSPASELGANGESRVGSFGVGGESRAHGRLKHYIAEHSEAVGLPRTLGKGQAEMPLPSGDKLDVLFNDGKDAIAIEVKSTISQEADIARGIYQCVKYVAVLEAQQSAIGLPKSARAILVLEDRLPPILWDLKNRLGVELFQEVKPR